MQLNWTDFPDAPDAGAFLCGLGEIPEGGVLSKSINGFGFLALLVGGSARVFVNACPHQFLPLDQRQEQVLSADGLQLLCSNHSAAFSVQDGRGIAGEGLGCRLSLIPIEKIGDGIFVKK